MTTAPLLQLQGIGKRFGTATVLHDIDLGIRRAEVHCLLGDNGAGKSTLIKILAGVHPPSEGVFLFDGHPVRFSSPRQALDAGIATVFQDLALVSMMSVARNFFAGREPTRKLLGLLPVIDLKQARRVASEKLAAAGIELRSPAQTVGTMSGGQRQCLAIARAIHFGARVLILDEPTAALGVRQCCHVLRAMHAARARGIAVVFITHNVHHAYAIGDQFTVLNRGQSLGTLSKQETRKEQLLDMMAGGAEISALVAELEGGR